MLQLAQADLGTGLEGDGWPFKDKPFPVNTRSNVDHRSICRSCDGLVDALIACGHRFTSSRQSDSVSAAFMHVMQHKTTHWAGRDAESVLKGRKL